MFFKIFENNIDMNWYKTSQNFGDILRKPLENEFLEDSFKETFKEEIKEREEQRLKKIRRDKDSFAIGTKVTKIVGSRRSGEIIAPFPWEESDDGTYKPPGEDGVPVRWEDGSKGYEPKLHLKVL